MDEADRLLDMGFRNEIDTILSYLPSVDSRQTLLYSATFPNSVQKIVQVALKPEHAFVDTIEEGEQQTNTHVPQQSMICTLDTVTNSVEGILLDHKNVQKGYKILVFFNTARTAAFMARLFQAAGYKVHGMHSRMKQTSRVKVAEQFHKGQNVMMFSSDVSARGVDYPGVTLVVQVGLTDREQYIHRLGRTGRAGQIGRGVLLLCDFETKFLDDIKDLDITSRKLPQYKLNQLKAVALLKSLPEELEKAGEQAYQAFLGYYNVALKRIEMDKHGVVQLANEYSQTIGFDKPPRIRQKTIEKMGLKGIPGLRTY